MSLGTILSRGDVIQEGNKDRNNELWYPEKEQPILCESARVLHAYLRGRLHKWNDESPFNTHILSLDGVSGSGKSSLAKDINDVVHQISHVSVYPIGVDTFITTPRSSPLRILMLESRQLFWQLIYDRKSMIDVLAHIVQANGKQCSIPILRHYDRSDGSIKPKTLHVPAGKKVVMVDGIDSTAVLKELDTVPPSPQTRLMVVTKPHVALQRAAVRDARQGRRSVGEARALREKEFAFLVPQICGENIKNVDVIYAPEGLKT